MSHNCKGCTGSHDDGWATLDDLVQQDPYEMLYVRCFCKLVGFSPAIWKEYGPRILVRNGMHSMIEECPPPENLPHEIKVICQVLGDRLPEVK